MRYDVVRKACDVQGITHTEKLVLIILSTFVNDDHGWCWPGIETVAKKACLTPRAVINVIDRLEDAGELMVEPGTGPHGTNRYHLTCVSRGAYSPPALPERRSSLNSTQSEQRSVNAVQGTSPTLERIARFTPERHSPPLNAVQGEPGECAVHPNDIRMSTHTERGAFPLETEVLEFAQQYPGNADKGIPAVIPESWAAHWWGWLTFKEKKFPTDWRTAMVWRFEREWQDGNEVAHGRLREAKGEKKPRDEKPVEPLTFDQMKRFS